MGKFLLLLFVFMSFTAFGRVVGKLQIFNAQSMAASVNTAGVDITNFDNVSVQAKFTGTNGTFTLKLQGANTLTSCTDAANTWTDQSGTSQAIAADGDFMWNLVGQGYRCLRLVYVKGTITAGTLNAVLNGKGL